MSLALVALLAPAFAAEPEPAPVGVTAQVRPRLEFSTGKDGAAGKETLIVSQRARLGVTANFPRVGLRATIQDVRTWGSEAHTLTDFTGDTIDLHEGWAQWKPTDGLALKVGRQEIVAHEQRLLGAVDWAQQGRSFDALTLAGRAGIFSADAGVAVLGDKDTLTNPNDAVLGFLRAGVAPGKATVDALAIVERDEGADLTRATAGVYAQAGAGALSGRIEAYGQLGNAGAAELQAGMVGVRGTWAPDAGVHPSVTLWYDLLSGDDDPADGKATAFNTLYATNHKFYGLMDVMLFTTGGAVDGQGLHDGALKLGVEPAKGLAVNLDAHVFAAAAPAGDTLLGEEADLWAGGKLAGGKLHLSGGASVLVWGDAARTPDAWVWMQTSLEL